MIIEQKLELESLKLIDSYLYEEKREEYSKISVSNALKKIYNKRYKETIIIYTNGGHYYSMVDKKYTVSNLPRYAKIWRDNMFKNSSLRYDLKEKLDFDD